MQKTAKLWCGTPPASTLSVSVENWAPVMKRNRSSIESPTARVLDPVEARAADPVGLDDAAVERVVEAGGTGDQLQVGPGAGELLRHRPQPAVVGTGDAVLEEAPAWSPGPQKPCEFGGKAYRAKSTGPGTGRLRSRVSTETSGARVSIGPRAWHGQGPASSS